MTDYPVRVDAVLDPHLSRWMWLVKWFLAIPHLVLLGLLWVAFALLTVFAFFAILFTGRYPRSVFEVTAGILRWNWRVTYYAFGVLGTDRYPPFTLADVPDYPARLEIAYPERLSRGLVLVKWWLLALPHYVVLGLLLGNAVSWTSSDTGERVRASSPGLIAVLALVAVVILAVRGQYPPALFALLVGLNRWVLRVAAYAALMTDAYPPFRLDMGGPDPAGVPPPTPPPHSPPA